MSERETKHRRRFAQRVRSLEAAAVAGLLFGALLIAALILLRRLPDQNASDSEIAEWLTSSGSRDTMVAALQLTTFSVIAFLWFIGVIRRRVGDREDRFFATVFLGSGLIVAALLLVGSSLLAAPTALVAPDRLPLDTDVYAGLQAVGRSVLEIQAQSLAGVFMLSTSTIVLRSKALPLWLAVVGYLAAVLVIVLPIFRLEEVLVFPAWVMLVSLVILVRRRRISGGLDASAETEAVGG